MGNLASAVDELLAVDPHELPGPVLAEEIVEIRRQANRLEAAYLARLEAFDRAGAALGTHGSTQAWLRQATNGSPASASRDVHLARDLADFLPATAAALGDGAISPEHAQVIATLRSTLPESAVRAAEPHLADAARVTSPVDLRRWARRVRDAYDPTDADADDQDDYSARRFSGAATVRGVGVGQFTLPAVMFETVMTAIHALSKPVARDDRTPAQRRADALVTMAEIVLRSGRVPVTGGVKPHVGVVVDAAALAVDSAVSDARPRPGDADHDAAFLAALAGGVTGVVAPGGDLAFGAHAGRHWTRRLLCDAAVSRIVMAAAGEILDSGRATRTFTAAQTRAIAARDRHCIWPGCDAPPGWCDAHHVHHWVDGGTTSVDNGVLVCGRHHDRIHLYGHAIVHTADGRRTVDRRPGSDPRWCGPRHRAGP